MRTCFFILSFAISLAAFGQDSINVPTVTANFDSIGTWGKIYTTITVTNNTSDTIRYYSMSCSYPDFFACDNKEIIIPGVDCEQNGQIIITLTPHGSDIKKLELKSTVEWKKLESIRFRIGLRYSHPLKKGSFKESESFDGKKHNVKGNSSKEVILWSNELIIHT